MVGSTLIIAQAVIADVFPGYERGEAMGAFMAPMLFGPVIAPLLGGIVAELYGWRACFIMLSVMTGPILFLTYLYVPETHHYYVKQRVHRGVSAKTPEDREIMKKNSQFIHISGIDSREIVNGEKEVKSRMSTFVKLPRTREDPAWACIDNHFDRYDPMEAERIKEMVVEHNHDYDTLGLSLLEAPMIAEPVFEMPWNALLLIFDPLISPFILTCAFSFALNFSALTIAPILLADDPYNLSEGLVGVTFLSFGVGDMLGAVVGGTISDASQNAFPSCKQGRMVYVLCFAPGIVIGGMLFAYTMQYGVNLAVVLIAQFIVGFSQSTILTNCMAYLSEVKPDKAAASCAVMMFLCFSLASICVACTVPAASVITLSGFFWIMSMVYLLSLSGWCYVVFTKLKSNKGSLNQPLIDTNNAAVTNPL
jgi:MFS family permease